MLVKSDDKIWRQVVRGGQSIDIGGDSTPVRTARLRPEANPNQRVLVWHWYWINGRLTTSDHLGKVWLALSKLTGQGDDSAAVFVYVLEDEHDGGEAALNDFLATGGSALADLLAGARGAR